MECLQTFSLLLVCLSHLSWTEAAPTEVQFSPWRWHHESSLDAAPSVAEPETANRAPSGRRAEDYGEDYVPQEIEFSDYDIGEMGKLDYYIDEGLEYYLDENLDINRTRFPTKQHLINLQKEGHRNLLGDTEVDVGLLDETLYKKVPNEFDFGENPGDFSTLKNLDNPPLTLDSNDNNNFGHLSYDHQYKSNSKIMETNEHLNEVDNNKNEDGTNFNFRSRFGDTEDPPEDTKQEKSHSNSDSNNLNVYDTSKDENNKDPNLETNSLNSGENNHGDEHFSSNDGKVYQTTQRNFIDFFMIPKFRDFFSIENQVYRLRNYGQNVQEKLKSRVKDMDEIMEAVE